MSKSNAVPFFTVPGRQMWFLIKYAYENFGYWPAMSIPLAGLLGSVFLWLRLPALKSEFRFHDYIKDQLFEDLKNEGALTIPQILDRCGATNSFWNRGKLAGELGKLSLQHKIIEKKMALPQSARSQTERYFSLPAAEESHL